MSNKRYLCHLDKMMHEGSDIFKPCLACREIVEETPVTIDTVENPKDAIGSDKLPIHLFPATAIALGSLANLHGNLKYGRNNWRAAKVRYTMYLDAIIRHAQAALEGEDIDPESGLPHESHILASAGIIVDANATGSLVDDRNYKGAFWRGFVDKWTPHVKRLKEQFGHNKPRHWSITDGR